jgi:hypothetical protein
MQSILESHILCDLWPTILSYIGDTITLTSCQLVSKFFRDQLRREKDFWHILEHIRSLQNFSGVLGPIKIMLTELTSGSCMTGQIVKSMLEKTWIPGRESYFGYHNLKSAEGTSPEVRLIYGVRYIFAPSYMSTSNSLLFIAADASKSNSSNAELISTEFRKVVGVLQKCNFLPVLVVMGSSSVAIDPDRFRDWCTLLEDCCREFGFFFLPVPPTLPGLLRFRYWMIYFAELLQRMRQQQQ